MFKTIETIIQTIDTKLTTIHQKIDFLEKGQNEFSQRLEKLAKPCSGFEHGREGSTVRKSFGISRGRT